MAVATKKNAEGYCDPTAYQALKNIQKDERRSKRMNIKRGDIYYVEKYATTGSEQNSGRPAIIVSNDKNNEYSQTVEVVYMTTQPKNDLPTHVTIRSTARESIALCEQVTTVSVDRLGDYKGKITKEELCNMEIGLLISLDLTAGSVKEKVVTKEVKVEVPVEVIKEVPVEVVKEVQAPVFPDKKEKLTDAMNKLAAANAKVAMLQAMYDSLLERVLCGKLA